MSWFLHAADWCSLNGRGYQFWSGIGSGSPILAAVIYGYRRHNCHVKRCPFPGHIDPEHGHPACKRHHSRRHLLGVAQAVER